MRFDISEAAQRDAVSSPAASSSSSSTQFFSQKLPRLVVSASKCNIPPHIQCDPNTPQPHVEYGSVTMWWDDARIGSVVSRHFVCSQLLPEEIARLDRPVGFGDGLTNESYWEWIDGKAKKIFLILVDLGVPDQIFGVIDDSWDDGDLPIALDQVDRLALTAGRDEKFEKKFYYRQFHYLLKPIRKGRHMVYQDMDIVPIDVVEKRPGLTSSQLIDKVVVHGESGKFFCRRRIPIGSGPGCLPHEDVQYHINSVKNLQNEHLVSYWASYTHHGHAYLLFTPARDASIKSLLANPAPLIKNLGKDARGNLVLNWILCLVDTLCFVHSKGLSQGQIKPSTILLNLENHIFYSDCNRLGVEKVSGDKTSFDKESYDYGAPEQWFRPPATLSTSPVSRRASILSPVNNFSSMDGGNILAPISTNSNIAATTFAISRGQTESSPVAMMHTPNPQLNPQAADIFSLGCVILELLSLLLKKQTKAFAAHRAAKHKTPGRGGAVPDSSFHKNLGQVESWMTSLGKDAAAKAKKEKEAEKKTGVPAAPSSSSTAKAPGARSSPPTAFTFFRGISPLLHVIERMLSQHPADRPTAHNVQRRVYQILREQCGIMEPHCVHEYGGHDYGLGGLKLPPSPTRTSMSRAARAVRRGPILGEEEEDDDEGLEDTPYMITAGSRRSHGRSDSGGSGYVSGSANGSASGRQIPPARRDIRGSEARDFGGGGGGGGAANDDSYNGYGNGYGQAAFGPGGIDMVVRSPVLAGHALDAGTGF